MIPWKIPKKKQQQQKRIYLVKIKAIKPWLSLCKTSFLGEGRAAGEGSRGGQQGRAAGEGSRGVGGRCMGLNKGRFCAGSISFSSGEISIELCTQTNGKTV